MCCSTPASPWIGATPGRCSAWARPPPPPAPPRPTRTSCIYAKRTAAALGYIGLAGFDRVTVAAFQRGDISRFAPVRGRGHAVNLLRFIAGVQGGGETDLDASLRAYAAHARYPRRLLYLQRFLHRAGRHGRPDGAAGGGHEIHVLHILAPAEVHPELALLGDLRLRDSETGQTQEVSIDSGLLDLYADKFAAWQGALAGLLPPPRHQLPASDHRPAVRRAGAALSAAARSASPSVGLLEPAAPACWRAGRARSSSSICCACAGRRSPSPAACSGAR